jgi:hypothetical protein
MQTLLESSRLPVLSSRWQISLPAGFVSLPLVGGMELCTLVCANAGENNATVNPKDISNLRMAWPLS